MGAHLIDDEFQSDRFPTCPRNKVPLSVTDPDAQPLLWTYAQKHRVIDSEFSADLETALMMAGYTPHLQKYKKLFVVTFTSKAVPDLPRGALYSIVPGGRYPNAPDRNRALARKYAEYMIRSTAPTLNVDIGDLIELDEERSMRIHRQHVLSDYLVSSQFALGTPLFDCPCLQGLFE